MKKIFKYLSVLTLSISTSFCGVLSVGATNLSGNPATGQRPISPIVWIAMVIAVLGIAGLILWPVLKKRFTDNSNRNDQDEGFIVEKNERIDGVSDDNADHDNGKFNVSENGEDDENDTSD